LTSNASALKSLRKLKALLKVLPIDEKVIEQALNADFNDFEDAIQYFSAINNGITLFLKRNKKDYKKSKLAVFNPENYLRLRQLG